MRIVFLQQARHELRQAVLYYEQQRAGLGARFREAVAECVEALPGRHQLHRTRAGGYRRVNLRGFPYYIPYFVRDGTLHVLAVAHASREPEYWDDRPPEPATE